MIESAIINKLKTDSTLIGLLSTFSGEPSIFANSAPEGADKKYIVIVVNHSEDEDSEMMDFNVFVNCYAFGQSSRDAVRAAERVEFLLDDIILQHERFLDVHLYYFSGGAIPDADPRSVQYNMQFTGQGIRSKWIADTK